MDILKYNEEIVYMVAIHLSVRRTVVRTFTISRDLRKRSA